MNFYILSHYISHIIVSPNHHFQRSNAAIQWHRTSETNANKQIVSNCPRAKHKSIHMNCCIAVWCFVSIGSSSDRAQVVRSNPFDGVNVYIIIAMPTAWNNVRYFFFILTITQKPTKPPFNVVHSKSLFLFMQPLGSFSFNRLRRYCWPTNNLIKSVGFFSFFFRHWKVIENGQRINIKWSEWTVGMLTTSTFEINCLSLFVWYNKWVFGVFCLQSSSFQNKVISFVTV